MVNYGILVVVIFFLWKVGSVLSTARRLISTLCFWKTKRPYIITSFSMPPIVSGVRETTNDSLFFGSHEVNSNDFPLQWGGKRKKGKRDVCTLHEVPHCLAWYSLIERLHSSISAIWYFVAQRQITARSAAWFVARRSKIRFMILRRGYAKPALHRL